MLREGKRTGTTYELSRVPAGTPRRDHDLVGLFGGGTARPRRPKAALSQSGSRSGDGAAVAGGDTLAVDFRDTPSRRLDEPRPRPRRPELVVSCMWQIVGTPPHGRGRRPTLPALATSTVPLLRQARGRRPGPNGSLLGLGGRPAHPMAFAVVATMRIGLEVGPRVGRQDRMYRRRRRWAEASRRSSPPLSVCAGAHDRPR
jgi:hypothetical protein